MSFVTTPRVKTPRFKVPETELGPVRMAEVPGRNVVPAKACDAVPAVLPTKLSLPPRVTFEAGEMILDAGDVGCEKSRVNARWIVVGPE